MQGLLQRCPGKHIIFSRSFTKSLLTTGREKPESRIGAHSVSEAQISILPLSFFRPDPLLPFLLSANNVPCFLKKTNCKDLPNFPVLLQKKCSSTDLKEMELLQTHTHNYFFLFLPRILLLFLILLLFKLSYSFY